MTHQELDDIFRANSERGEFAPEPGEWEEMTAMLDADERRQRRARWVSLGWMSLFVLLIGVGIYGLWNTQKDSSTNSTYSIVDRTPADSDKLAPQTTVGTGPVENAIPEQGSISALPEINANPAGQNVSTGAADDVVNTGLATSAAFAKTPSSSKPDIADEPSSRSSYIAKERRPSLGSADAAPTSSAVASGIFTNSSADLVPLTLDQKEGVAQKGVEIGETTANTKVKEASSTSIPSFPAAELSALSTLSLSDLSTGAYALYAPPIQQLERQPKFGFGLFLAEEVTSVAMSSDMRLGTRIGGQFHFRPFDKWSIDLGISYAHKSYVAPDGEMQNTLGLFVDDVLPFQTDGECDILELPLTVTFLPKGHGQAGPFVSAGVLSYRIFREQMVFHYDEPTNQVVDAMAPDMGSLFGTVHVQAGYRFVPKRGPAWRLGPYVQVPMKMVGSGKLPIYSGGLQLEVELF